MTQGSHIDIDHSDVPIRLFKSDFLEFFTHISPLVVLLIWVPVFVGFLVAAIVRVPAGGSWLHIPAGFFLGIFIWTFAEYTLHRFVFHYTPRTPWQERITFLFHGIHHAQPQCKTRLVMPPVVSVPMAFLFYGFFWLVFGRLVGLSVWTWPSFSGFHRRLPVLRYDSLCHTPPPDAPGIPQVPQALSHATPLQNT